MLIAMALPGVEVYADIAAPIEQVWDLVSDISLMPAFSTELQSVEWADGFDPWWGTEDESLENYAPYLENGTTKEMP